jgi:type IV pilus assembly protein PilV
MNAMTRKSPHGSKGFTLIEMLMAMLIMTVGLLGLLQSVNIALEHKNRTRLRDEALVIAEEQMNEWRIKDFEKIDNEDIPKLERSIGGSPKQFAVFKRVTPMGDTKKLRVAVTWEYKQVLNEHEIFTVKNK